MIINHKYKYIFIKTRKVAGTSVEMYLNKHREPGDIFTPISSWHEDHIPQNFEGSINPIKELIETKLSHTRRTLSDFKNKIRFWNHIPGIMIKSRIEPDIWNNYYKFTIERNPWDKTISHYFWLKRKEEFSSIRDYIKKSFLPVDYDKYTNLNGELLVDRVVRYESLNDDLGEIFSELGIPYEGSLGIFAKSSFRKKRDYSDYYDKETKNLVARAFRKEIKLFGYKF